MPAVRDAPTPRSRRGRRDALKIRSRTRRAALATAGPRFGYHATTARRLAKLTRTSATPGCRASHDSSSHTQAAAGQAFEQQRCLDAVRSGRMHQPRCGRGIVPPRPLFDGRRSQPRRVGRAAGIEVGEPCRSDGLRHGQTTRAAEIARHAIDFLSPKSIRRIGRAAVKAVSAVGVHLDAALARRRSSDGGKGLGQHAPDSRLGPTRGQGGWRAMLIWRRSGFRR